MGKYDDIIRLPHHQSAKHPHMDMISRAAQFAPFAALTGFDAKIDDATVQNDILMDTVETVKFDEC